MEEKSLLAELRECSLPGKGKSVCPCLDARLKQGYPPEKLNEALAELLREACERLLAGKTHLSEALVIALRVMEGREWLRTRHPQLALSGQELLLSWPDEMLCHSSRTVTAYLARALGYEVRDLPWQRDPSGLQTNPPGVLGLIRRSAGSRPEEITAEAAGSAPVTGDLDLLLRLARSLDSQGLCPMWRLT